MPKSKKKIFAKLFSEKGVEFTETVLEIPLNILVFDEVVVTLFNWMASLSVKLLLKLFRSKLIQMKLLHRNYIF